MRYIVTQSDIIGLLQTLLTQKHVTEVLSGVEKKNRYSIIPEFTSDPAQLTAFPLSQLLVYGYSRTDSASNTLLHTKKALTTKVAVIARACDVRAMVELEKKQQLVWENLIIFCFHDLGYVPEKDLTKFFKTSDFKDTDIASERLTPTTLIFRLKNKTIKQIPLGSELNITDNCGRCVQKSHPLADFLIGTYGLPVDSDLYIITPQSIFAQKLIDSMQWQNKAIDDAFNQTYEKVASEVLARCQEQREKEITAFDTNPDRFDLLTKCTACGMCVRSCPVCYCNTCNLLDQVKAKRMDRMMFLTTRFSHIGDTCIECGRCSLNCPMNIPLDLVFQSIREKLRKSRKYEAGSIRQQKVFHLDI